MKAEIVKDHTKAAFAPIRVAFVLETREEAVALAAFLGGMCGEDARKLVGKSKRRDEADAKLAEHVTDDIYNVLCDEMTERGI